MISILFMLSLFLVGPLPPVQEKLPDYGTISDIKGMTKVYVSAPSTDERKTTLNELKKAPSLVSVNSPDAEFFLEYRIVNETHPYTILRFVTAELSAYTLKDGRKRIVWSKTKGVTSKGDIARDFVKAFKKMKSETK